VLWVLFENALVLRLAAFMRNAIITFLGPGMDVCFILLDSLWNMLVGLLRQQESFSSGRYGHSEEHGDKEVNQITEATNTSLIVLCLHHDCAINTRGNSLNRTVERQGSEGRAGRIGG